MKARIWGIVLTVLASCMVGAETPSVLNEAAMWLDASDPQYLQFNDTGAITNWINRSASRSTYGDAKAGNPNWSITRFQYGRLVQANGVPAVGFRSTGSGVDYTFTRISTIRTVFLVGCFKNDDALEPLLGDSQYHDFHRGKSGYVWNKAWAQSAAGFAGYSGVMTFYLNSSTTTCAADTTAPTANALNIITIECPVAAHANVLSSDRETIARSGGRALSEVLIFTRALTAAERTAVYNYLDAKWKQGGWDTGVYNLPSLAYTDDVSVDMGKTNLFTEAGAVSVASGKTASFSDYTSAENLSFTGGGTLDLAGGADFAGTLTQTAGTLNLGGGTLYMQSNPTLSGNVTWSNGLFDVSFSGEFRPPANTTLTLADGARVFKDLSGRSFFDKGNVTLNLETGSEMNVAGPFNVSIDYQTTNYLNINGGTLVVTNNSSRTDFHANAITIGSQLKSSTAYMTMTSGRIYAGKLRAAAAWGSVGTAVNASGTITVGGGTIDLFQCLELGTSSGTRGHAYVYLNGGEITSTQGVDMYADDIDTLTLNGVTFHALVDTAPYFNLRKSNGANTSLGANGFTMDVASGKTVRLGWGFKGTGGITKSGAGTLTLDKAATFTGGLTVSEGTAVLSTASSAGTGVLRLGVGATLDAQAATLPLTASSFTADGGTLIVTVASSGKQAAMPTSLTELPAGLTLVAKDAQGTVLPSATLSIENGTLYVIAPSAWTADVADASSADWYALAWQNNGASAAYPTTVGTVMDAILTVAGTSSVSLGSTVHAGRVVYTNAAASASVTTSLGGTGPLDAVLDLTGFTGDFRLVDGLPISGGVSFGAKTNLFLWADAGSTWTNANTFTGTAALRKGGAGTVVWPTFPALSINAVDGIFAFIEASNVSRSSNTMTGSGTKEKRGAGTLTVTGGSWPGNWRVTEGTLTINAAFTSAGTGIYVGKGAKILVPHCSQVSNRLPYNSQVVVDGGTFEVGGVNPFNSSYSPEFFVTNGTFSVLNTTGAEHIKFKALTLKDSNFIIRGTKEAYSKNAIYMVGTNKITSDGNVSMTFENSSCPNSITGGAAITLAVNSGTNLFAVSTLQTINKTGAGMIRFPAAVANNSTAFVYVKEGKVGGGQIKYLALYAGVTIAPDEANPLTVTGGFSLPGDSVSASTPVLIDISGIDFTDRTKEVVVMKYANQSVGDRLKFACANLPAGWQICVDSGVYLRKVASQQKLTWTTGNGTWSETDFNNGTTYVDGYHSVAFADSANAATTVTLDGTRSVAGFDFAATNTFYTLTGASGFLQVPSFAPTGKGGFSIDVPLLLDITGLTFEPTTADQTITDVRVHSGGTTVGAVNIPAAAGGTVLLTHTDSSPRQVGGITIGSGKTLEWRNNSSSANPSSLNLTSPVVGDASTKLVITAPKAGYHTDITKDCPNFKGQLEVTDGGWLYLSGQFNQITATKDKPVWVHGKGSELAYYGNQQGNRFPNDGWIRVTDGGILEGRGINPTSQNNAPYVVASNGTIQVEGTKGSTVHLHDIYLHGESTFALTGTGSAWNGQCVAIHGQVYVEHGTSTFTRVEGPNYAWFGGNSNTSGTFDVAVGAKLNLSCALTKMPYKTGAGDIELSGAFESSQTMSMTVNGGYLVANATANKLTAVTVANGAGFDLSADDSCFAPTNGVALAADASARLNLKTGSRDLELNEYLVKWTSGSGPSCSFKLVTDEARQYCWSVVRVADGVKVGRRSFVILLR